MENGGQFRENKKRELKELEGLVGKLKIIQALSIKRREDKMPMVHNKFN